MAIERYRPRRYVPAEVPDRRQPKITDRDRFGRLERLYELGPWFGLFGFMPFLAKHKLINL